MNDAACRQGGHLSASELELYVIDALSDGRKGAVEQHVFECEVCAEALAREASVEAALEEVARRAGSGRTLGPALTRAAAEARAARVARVASLGGRRSRWAGGVAGALAAAAALVLAFASSRSEAAGVAQRSATFGDAAGDMSGALASEVRRDSLDGG